MSAAGGRRVELRCAASPVVLPWVDAGEGSCFGCSPDNPVGLGLRFEHDPADPDALVTWFAPGEHHVSYPGIVHGGLVALVCDEAMGNLVVLRHGIRAVTTSLRMRYVGALHPGARHRCRARAGSTPSGSVAARAEITDVDGVLLATATATYHPVPVPEPTARPAPHPA